MDLIKKLKPEDELLILCARTRLSPEIRNNMGIILNNNLDWDYLIKVAENNKLTSIFYWNLSRNWPDDVPIQVMSILKENYNNNVKKNLLMFKELIEVIKLFNSNSITPIPYKGPILAIEEYGNLSLREFNDIDIFLQFKDVFKAKELLLKNGYVADVNLEPSRELKFIETQRDLKFIHCELKMVLEIHWTFDSLYLTLPQSTDLYDENKVTEYELRGLKVKKPSDEDMFLILCLHNASHRWVRLSWLCDINEFVESHNLNWHEILFKAENLVIKKIILMNLYLGNDLLGMDIPKEFLNEKINRKLVETMKSYIFTEKKKLSLTQEALISFKLRERAFYGIKDVLNGLTKPGVCEWKSLSLPPFLWRLYYMYRPFNLIKRYLREN